MSATPPWQISALSKDRLAMAHEMATLETFVSVSRVLGR